MKTTDRYGFFSAYASDTAKAGVWQAEFINSSFEGPALIGQRNSKKEYGSVNSVTFAGSNTINATGLSPHNANVYAENVVIGGDFSMTGDNNAIFFKSIGSSGVGTGKNAYGRFVVMPGAKVNMARKLSSTTSNTYKGNLIEGYESYIFEENSDFTATAGTNISSSNKCFSQTAIIYSGAAKEFTVKSGAKVELVSDHSLTKYTATHGTTALSLRKPVGGNLAITVQPAAALNIVAYGTNARSRDLAPVLISSLSCDNSGTSQVLVQGNLTVYSKNGNGWHYQNIDFKTTGHDSFTVDGGMVDIHADGREGWLAIGEYAALEHNGRTSFDLELRNGGVMNIRSNGWMAMSLAGGNTTVIPKKTITVRGSGSKLYLKGGRSAIVAGGKTDFALNVLSGGFVSTWNIQSANIYTGGQAAYNVEGAGSCLEMVRIGEAEEGANKYLTSQYGVIFHDDPLVGPLKINVTNGGYMSVKNSLGSRAAITAQGKNMTGHVINVSGSGSTLSVINNNSANSASKIPLLGFFGIGQDTTNYPVGAIAFAANCSGNINIGNGGSFYAESNSPDSPTIALGNSASSNLSGELTLNNPGKVDIKNNAATSNERAIALRGRNYDPKTNKDSQPALTVNQSNISVWNVGAGQQNWLGNSMVDRWINASFTAANSAATKIAPGSLHGTTQFTLSKYGRIYVDD
jgi:hypothetical protein